MLHSLRIATNVPLGSPNPYLRLFYRALAEYGIELVGELQPTLASLHQHGQDFDAIHFHWPESILRRRPEWVRRLQSQPGCWRLGQLLRRAAPPLLLRQFRKFLDTARQLDKQIIWTVHNLAPHEGRSRIQEAGFAYLASQAHLIICHDEHTAQECRGRFRTNANIVLMPHGNYDGAYPTPRPREVVRAELGVDENTTLLSCLGGIRQYKGTDVACRAARLMGPNVRLLIAGAVHPMCPREPLVQAVTSANALFHPHTLTPQEFADFAAASDLILLPYREVTGSGALLAALTFGRGVVASDLPYFRAILSSTPDAGALAPAGDPDGLAQTVSEYLRTPAARRNTAARKLADQFSWNHVVKPVVDSLKTLNKSNRVVSPAAP